MDVVSVCPLRVASVSWRPERGPHALTVVCRGTFRLVAGAMTPSDNQLAPSRKDQFLRPAGPSSLVVASDLVPAKRGVDVVLVGHAHAPEAQPATAFTTRLVVGAVDKRVEVFAERFFTTSGEIVQAARTAEVPLVWERAAGGPGTPNPVGVPTTRRDSLGRVALPQLQPAGLRVTDPDQAIPPACYGPIAPSWPDRLAHLGAHEPGWSAERWWTRPLPDGFDLAYFNVAPDDQRLERLHGDESVVLENLLAAERELRTRLPAHAPIGTLTRRRGKPEPLDLVADTIWFDVDQAICTITWRGQVTLWHPAEQGRVEIDWAERPPRAPGAVSAPRAAETARGIGAAWLAMPVDDPDGGVTEPSYLPDDDDVRAGLVPGVPGAAAHLLRDALASPAPTFDGDATVPFGELAPSALPFQPAPLGATPAALPLPSSGVPNGGGPPGAHLRIGASPRESTAVTSATAPAGDAAPPLPFRSSGGPVEASEPARPSSAGDAPLPFRKSVPPSGLGVPVARPSAIPSAPPPPLVRPAVGPAAPIAPPRPSSPWLGPDAAGRAVGSRGRATVSPTPPATPELSDGEAPAPPPLIGPLATPEMVARQGSVESTASGVDDATEPPISPSAEPLAERTADGDETRGAYYEPGVGLRLLRLDACARVGALLDRRPDDEAQILAEHGLDRASWRANEAYWGERIREETSRGRAQLLRQHDAAYVQTLERERGPIEAEEYARLVVGAERGQAARALRELSLPAGAMVRIERVFLRRVVESAALGEKIRRAIEAARGA